MKRLVVSGNFGEPKSSSVSKKLARHLYADIYNGGTIELLESAKRAVKEYDITVWMPNISNEEVKDYPRKKVGSILVCSKLMHEGVGVGDAVARIFKMGANAVIAVYTDEKPFKFKLIDALGNLWVETSDMKELSNAIEDLAKWTKESIRVNTIKNPDVTTEQLKIS